MQKILIMSTKHSGLRSEAIGWTSESGEKVIEAWENLTVKTDTDGHPIRNRNDMFIGYVGAYRCPCYPTVLHALSDDWKLLAPPKDISWTNDHTKEIVAEWEWWLVKD
jgi:hypothetical protein